MSGPALDVRTLGKAPPASLVRLARFVGIRVDDDAEPGPALLEELARRVGRAESWPPRATERRW